MATMRRLLRTPQSWRSTLSPKTLSPSPVRSCSWSSESHIDRIAYEGQWPKSVSETPLLFFPIVPAILAGLFGFALLDVAYADADANEVVAKPSLPSECPSSHVDLEEIARKERQRLEELLKSKGLFTVAVKGQRSRSSSKFLLHVKFPTWLQTLFQILDSRSRSAVVQI